MVKRKTILAGSIVAGALMAVTGFTAQSTGMFNYKSMGSGDEVRTNLLRTNSNSRTLELKCGEKGKTDSTMSKKGKDGKCGEGKCGDKSKTDSVKTKKGKDGKCGEGKCGATKKKTKN